MDLLVLALFHLHCGLANIDQEQRKCWKHFFFYELFLLSCQISFFDKVGHPHSRSA